MKPREYAGVLHGRPHQCGALGGSWPSPPRSFRLVPSGDFECYCLRDTPGSKGFVKGCIVFVKLIVITGLIINELELIELEIK